MSAKIRTSLVGLVAVILLLAVAAPAFAKTHGTNCWVWWLGVTKDEEVVKVMVGGLGDVTFSGNTATVTCEGTIPLGEKYIVYTLYDLDEMRDYLGIDAHPFIISVEGTLYVHDFKSVPYESEYWELLVKENGNFILEVVFDLSED